MVLNICIQINKRLVHLKHSSSFLLNKAEQLVHYLNCKYFWRCPLRLRLVSFYLARKNLAESSKGFAQSFVVDAFVQVLDENVANSRFPETGISLRPHYPHWLLPFDGLEIH